MRERSSPGIRKSLVFSKGPEFEAVYKSIERLGGIGSNRSNIDRRELSQASNRGQSPSIIGDGKIKAIRSVVKEDKLF